MSWERLQARRREMRERRICAFEGGRAAGEKVPLRFDLERAATSLVLRTFLQHAQRPLGERMFGLLLRKEASCSFPSLARTHGCYC